MKKIFLSLLFCGIIFSACNSSTENKEAVNSETPPTDKVMPDPATIQETSPEVAPATTSPMSGTTQQGQQINASATGMNPAHGEPGHRCDIAVGAPLNSPPGNMQAPANSPTITSAPATAATPLSPGPAISNLPQSAPVNVDPASSPTTTAPGMNPPHGQPGHDCSIPVGSPLKK